MGDLILNHPPRRRSDPVTVKRRMALFLDRSRFVRVHDFPKPSGPSGETGAILAIMIFGIASSNESNCSLLIDLCGRWGWNFTDFAPAGARRKRVAVIYFCRFTTHFIIFPGPGRRTTGQVVSEEEPVKHGEPHGSDR